MCFWPKKKVKKNHNFYFIKISSILDTDNLILDTFWYCEKHLNYWLTIFSTIDILSPGCVIMEFDTNTTNLFKIYAFWKVYKGWGGSSWGLGDATGWTDRLWDKSAGQTNKPKFWMSSKSAPIIVYFAQGDPPQKNQHNWPPLMSVYNYEGRKNDHLMQLFSMLRKNLGKAKELLFKKSFEGCKIFCFRGGLQKVEFLVSHVHLASIPIKYICTIGVVSLLFEHFLY